MESDTEYLSKAEFAARQGWSPSYVTKLKDQGRLVYSDAGRLIDVAATLALLEEIQAPGIVRRAERERCAKIIAYGMLRGRVNEAGALAFNSSMPAAQAIAALDALMPERGGEGDGAGDASSAESSCPDMSLWAGKYVAVSPTGESNTNETQERNQDGN